MSLFHASCRYFNMARKLQFFHDITLNSGRDTHFFYREFYKFFNYLVTNYQAGSAITDDNYRINTNIVRVSQYDSAFFDKENVSRITYVIEYERNDGDPTKFYFYRCYIIKNYTIASNYVTFELEQDRWANNIEKATIYGLDIKRCNRVLGNGIYDEVKHTIGDFDIKYYEGWLENGNYTIGANHVAIAVLLQFNISQAVFGTDKTTRTIMFLTDTAQRVYDDIGSHISNNYKYDSYLELLAGAVGTITGVTGNLGTLDAQVIKAWVVDTQLVDVGFGALSISAECSYGDYNTSITLTYLEPQQRDYNYKIEDVSPNKVYYIGTYLNGLKLKPYYEKHSNKLVLNFTHTYIVDDNELKVIFSQGERIKDVSNMFELYLNTNASQTTSLRLFARSWSQAVGMGKGAISDFTKGGGGSAGGVMTGLGISKGIADMIPQNPSFENAIGGGDAMHTFGLPRDIEDDENINAEYCRSPYCYIEYSSAFDEEQNAGLYGLNYEKTYLYQLDDLFSDSYPKINSYYRDFLQCDCEVEGAQSDDANFITDELRRGIFIGYIDDYLQG